MLAIGLHAAYHIRDRFLRLNALYCGNAHAATLLPLATAPAVAAWGSSGSTYPVGGNDGRLRTTHGSSFPQHEQRPASST